MFRSHRNALRLRHALSIAAILALALSAVLVRPAAAADSYLDIHAQNNLDRRVYIECRVKPGSFSTSISMTVEPGHNIKMTFQPIRLGAEVATMHCGAFDYAGGSKGAPIFPGAGSGGMSPVGVMPLPQGGTRTVTYVAKQPQPHFEGIN
ncbi:hypothetical protein ACFOGJ_22275 [Marinibaculum pumilum]|uniref:Uncharacterized protein n=1 Tax=Marinibaculum pumilum TaxID=1766165 RepID=A0ABV7L5Y9_9PROT